MFAPHQIFTLSLALLIHEFGGIDHFVGGALGLGVSVYPHHNIDLIAAFLFSLQSQH